MAVAESSRSTAPAGRTESKRLVWAFAISLALHLLLYGGYQGGKRLGLWRLLNLETWLQPTRKLSELQKKQAEQEQQANAELPLVFVEVSPSQATEEAPKTAVGYSDKNSLAANPEPKKETETPEVAGKQTQIIRTEEVPRTKAFPLQPSPAAPKTKEAQEEIKASPAYTPGDLAVAKPDQKPDPTPRKDEGKAPRPRPRTIEEALARQDPSRLAGEKMKQEGGVKRRAPESSLDVRSSPFGDYDKAIIYAVQNRWYDLLDSRNYARDRAGKVTVRFHLNADGSVSEMTFTENTVDLMLGLLCQSAIKDPAPFGSWPPDMRKLVGADYREVTFTFYYN